MENKLLVQKLTEIATKAKILNSPVYHDLQRLLKLLSKSIKINK
ncbi:MAG: hypothetical protein QW156_02455 [Candidatus Aenigmatarchaeota archaeon]